MASTLENMTFLFAKKNKAADQPAYVHGLIGAYVFPILQNAIFKLASNNHFIILGVLFDLILYVPSTIFRLNMDESSWVDPVLS